MSELARLSESIGLLGRSLFDRGRTPGASGNISARLADGSLLVTPTGQSLGRLDPAGLARLGADGRPLAGPAPARGRSSTCLRPMPSPCRSCPTPTPTTPCRR
jgi:ribulose-5-phosphate 4-epimerase/fuculose-1-phosphate aldolase